MNAWDPKERVPASAINLNPPSIPSHNYVYGYEEDLHGKLIQQKNTEPVHTGLKNDNVGPGQYELELKKVQKGTTKWVESFVPDKIVNIKRQKGGL